MRVYRSSFLKTDVDLEELSRLVADALGVAYRLTPLGVKCTYPVFRGDAEGQSPVFVKVGTADEWSRTVALLKEIGDCDYFARPLTEKFVEYRGYAVFVTTWCEGRMVRPEDMNDAQLRSFADGCARLSSVLQRVPRRLVGASENLSPEHVWGLLATYARRHPLAARPLRELLALPPAARSYAGRRLAVVHGDFHVRNYAFAGDRFAHVFDFDKVTEDLACGDFVQALVYRFSVLGLPRDSRRRLVEATRRLLPLVPWPREELAVMANVWRLRFVARRLERHPDSFWTGFDAFRRDRLVRELSQLIQEVEK
jgi:Ser/Thr protein kinase RdoA (MazF antagonist)